MAACVVCDKQLSFWGQLATLWSGRCLDCMGKMLDAKKRWLEEIEQAWNHGGVSRELEQDIYTGIKALKIPEEIGHPVVKRLQYLRSLSEIRFGNIPVIRADMHLGSDEIAHFQMQTIYYKPNKQVKLVPGQIIGTNKKLYFLSTTGRDSATIDWNNVSRVEQTTVTQPVPAQGIRITVSRGSGGGVYRVEDSLYSKTLIDTLVGLWKRQIVLYQENKTHGTVPEHVKTAVYKRDGGRCVQCGSDADGGKYLEYDHILPRSRGGPNTVDNIQLLRRKCNLKKSNRI